MDSTFTLNNLNAVYSDIQVLYDINLQIKRGEPLAVIGESGAGKTTLGKSIIGLCEGIISGEINWKNRNLIGLPEKEMTGIRGKEISIVFQNVDEALHPLYKIKTQISESLVIHGTCKKNEAGEKAVDLLVRAGLAEELSSRYPHELSGGQKQKTLIALALANDPDIIIFDEPTASLDPSTRAEMTCLIREVSKDRITLIITHDMISASLLSDKTAVLYGGRILEYGNTDDILKNPRHPYSRGLIRSFPTMDRAKDLQGVPGHAHRSSGSCPFFNRCTQSTDGCSSLVPELKEQSGRKIACHRGGIIPLLKTENLCAGYNGTEIIKNIDLLLTEGETLAVAGESGSGKTTLARAIMGLAKITDGRILLDSKAVEEKDKTYFSKVQMIMQNPSEALSHRMTILESVREPLDIQTKLSDEEKIQRVKSVLREVELPCDNFFLNTYPHHLSTGEIQRCTIARALVTDPSVLIADEPTSALDPSVQAKILKLLMNLQENRGMSILFITHDIAVARKISDHIMILHEGRIIEQGRTDEVLKNPGNEFTEKLIRDSAG